MRSWRDEDPKKKPELGKLQEEEGNMGVMSAQRSALSLGGVQVDENEGDGTECQ